MPCKRKYGGPSPFRPHRQKKIYKSSLNKRTGGFLGIENKFMDHTHSAALVTSTNCSSGEFEHGTSKALNAIAAGDGESDRDGRQVVVNKIELNCTVTVPAQVNQTAKDVHPEVFVALVQDTQTNATQLDSEKVFFNPSGNATTCVVPFRNLQYIKRFKVLATKLIRMPMPSSSWDGTNIEVQGTTRAFKLKHSFKRGLKCNFSGTTAVVGSIVDNSIHCIAFCSTTDAAPTMVIQSRCRFTG